MASYEQLPACNVTKNIKMYLYSVTLQTCLFLSVYKVVAHEQGSARAAGTGRRR